MMTLEFAKPRRLFFLLTLLGIFLTGCSFVRIQNVSDTSITVAVRVPDSGKAYTRNIRPGQVVDVFTSHGGSYTVTMIPSERYKAALFNLREIVTRRLFEERSTLSGDDVTRLVANLNEIDSLIDDLANEGASCQGTVPDFDTSVVVVVFDIAQDEYVISCSSSSE
jgi:hypothetical protein